MCTVYSKSPTSGIRIKNDNVTSLGENTTMHCGKGGTVEEAEHRHSGLLFAAK